jgi:hypothetical protein
MAISSSNSIFSITQKKLPFLGINFTYPHITPVESTIDVVDDFAWKNNVSRTSTSEVPSLTLTEYSLPYGRWMQNIANIFTNGGGLGDKSKGIDPYASLYTGIPTGFKYRLPYLISPGSTLKGKISNDWQKINLLENLQHIPGVKALQGAEKIAENIYGNFGYEQLRGFKGTTPRTITITFPLYNTINPIYTAKNYWLISLIGLQNLKVRTTYLTFIPPKIYTVASDSDGSVYMPAAFVSGYNVYSIGATRSIELAAGWEVLIPEAYKVEMQLTDMVDPSTNLDAGSFDPSQRVSVVQRGTGDPAAIGGGIENIGAAARQAVETVRNLIKP